MEPDSRAVSNQIDLIQLVPSAVISPLEPPQGPSGLTGTANLDTLDKNGLHARIDPRKQRRILSRLFSPAGELRFY